MVRAKVIRLHKGLDIPLLGEPSPKVTDAPLAASYSVSPGDFPGLTPKLLVSEGDSVKAGSALFFDKMRPEILFASPVSGTVAAIVRGEKRKILGVTITPDAQQQSEDFGPFDLASADREAVAGRLQKAGLWPMLIQRPYGIVAGTQDIPKAIFISGFDSAPLAGDFNFMLSDQLDNLNAGVAALRKLTLGKVHLSLKAGSEGVLNKVEGVEQHFFKGPHPAGNVGVQIHHIDPVNKGEVVWTIDAQQLAILGRFMLTGKVNMTKVIAITGSELADTHYVRVISGAAMDSIIRKTNIRPQDEGHKLRIISGNVLTGAKVQMEGHLTYYANQVTVIPEGDKFEMLGWIMPRLNKFSVSRSYFSWLRCHKEYTLDTNMNGGERAYVVTGLYERYLPMDIYPMYLLKAILAGDIDKMENLGIYEVIEEDFALCEFVDPSKTEMQAIIRRGIQQMIKELN